MADVSVGQSREVIVRALGEYLEPARPAPSLAPDGIDGGAEDHNGGAESVVAAIIQACMACPTADLAGA